MRRQQAAKGRSERRKVAVAAQQQEKPRERVDTVGARGRRRGGRGLRRPRGGRWLGAAAEVEGWGEGLRVKAKAGTRRWWGCVCA